MIRRAIVTGRPIRQNDRLLMAVAVQDDVIGVLALLDPDETAGEREEQTLRRGAIALAVELARLRGPVAVERHLGAGNLVEDPYLVPTRPGGSPGRRHLAMTSRGRIG